MWERQLDSPFVDSFAPTDDSEMERTSTDLVERRFLDPSLSISQEMDLEFDADREWDAESVGEFGAEDEIVLRPDWEVMNPRSPVVMAEQLTDRRSLGTVRYPSGKFLNVVDWAAPKDSEHYDPNHVGNPLLDTSGEFKNLKLSKSFQVDELAQSGNVKYDIARIDIALVQALQRIRDALGKPVRVNSGYRSFFYNREVYKRDSPDRKPTKSRHTSGQAADIRVGGMTGLEIAMVAVDVLCCDIGVGVANTYAHIDTRGVFAAWGYGLNANEYKRTIRQYHQRKCRRTNRSRAT